MYKLIIKLRSNILVWLTHSLALPILKLVRKPERFPYSRAQLNNFPLGTIGKDLADFLDTKDLQLLPYYARHDMKTPMRVSLATLALTQVLNIAFVPFLQHAGLTLSIGLAQLVNAAALLVLLRRTGGFQAAPGWGRFILQVAIATAVLGALLAWGAHRVDWVALRDARLLRAGLLAAFIAGAALLYFGVLTLTGVKLRTLIRR